MSSHFIHMNPKKTHDRYLTKTLDTNVTSEDKSKSKSSIIIINPKKHLTTISYTIKQIKYYSYNQLIKKYNTLPQKYNLIQLDKFITGKYCRSLASFKEKLMFNYDEEFLKKYYKIKEIKKSYTPEKLCEGLPPQFKEYISYTRNLHYEQDPDYNYLKRLFLTVLKNYNYEFDYYYDWKYLKITKKENKDKDKDNKSINFHRINYLDEKHKTSDLCNKISSLISQRKSIRGVFDYDRFVCDIDEESKINIQKMKLGYQTETINYFDDPNSIIPLPSHKKVVNHNGCLPCTSSSFNDKDNSCCIIY